MATKLALNLSVQPLIWKHVLYFMHCKKIICKSKVNVKVVSLQNHLTQGLSYLANFSICLSICEFLKKIGTLLFRCFGPLNISNHPFSYLEIKSLKTHLFEIICKGFTTHKIISCTLVNVSHCYKMSSFVHVKHFSSFWKIVICKLANTWTFHKMTKFKWYVNQRHILLNIWTPLLGSLSNSHS